MLIVLTAALAGACDADGERRQQRRTAPAGEPGPSAATEPADAEALPAERTDADTAALEALRKQAGPLLALDGLSDKTAFETSHPPPLRAAMFRAALSTLAFEPEPRTDAARADRALALARAYALAAPPRLARPVVSALDAWVATVEGREPDGAEQTTRRERFDALAQSLAAWTPPVSRAPRPGGTPELRLDAPFRVDPSTLRAPPVDPRRATSPEGAFGRAGGDLAGDDADAVAPGPAGAATAPPDPAAAAPAGRRPVSDGSPGAAADRRALSLPVRWQEGEVRVSVPTAAARPDGAASGAPAGATDAAPDSSVPPMPSLVRLDVAGGPALEVPLTWPAVRIGEPGVRRVPMVAEVLVPQTLPARGEALRLARLQVTHAWRATDSVAPADSHPAKAADGAAEAAEGDRERQADDEAADDGEGGVTGGATTTGENSRPTGAVPKPSPTAADTVRVLPSVPPGAGVHVRLGRVLCGLPESGRAATAGGDPVVRRTLEFDGAAFGGSVTVFAAHAFGGSDEACRVVTLAVGEGHVTVAGQGLASDGAFVAHISTLLASVEPAP